MTASRQRRWQQRKIAEGLCSICGGERVGEGVTKELCGFHAGEKNKRVRIARQKKLAALLAKNKGRK